jgi:threonine/homoserine/homoserine lactone efflux protein
MPNHLESKTMAGLLLLLLAAVGLAVAGKLTGEASDVIKWIGSSFLAMRAAANVSENMAAKKE